VHESSGGRRGYGEAARLGDRGDVDVQPLAREVVEGRLLSMKVLERCLASFKGCRFVTMRSTWFYSNCCRLFKRGP
jgi:hypothetical protein